MKKRRFIRFKMWLIKKLGGFTEQIIYEPIHIHSPTHVTLAYEQIIEPHMKEMSISEEDIIHSIEAMMVHELATKIFTEHLYTVDISNTEYWSGREVIRITTQIIPPFSKEIQEEIRQPFIPWNINH